MATVAQPNDRTSSRSSHLPPSHERSHSQQQQQQYQPSPRSASSSQQRPPPPPISSDNLSAPGSAMLASPSPSASSPSPGHRPDMLATAQSGDVNGGEEADFADVLCGGCGLVISEDSADAGVIHFATQLWHIDCFRCAKCRERVSTDRDDILLLSDGHPICGQCNYSCQVCRQPILEEAIMTGDESYHASCFTCRSCHSRIEELVFAKTSQGIYCMPCHNERVARSRRHADNRRRTRNKDGMAGPSSSSTSSRRKKVPEASPDTLTEGTVPSSNEAAPPALNAPQLSTPQPPPIENFPATPSPRRAESALGSRDRLQPSAASPLRASPSRSSSKENDAPRAPTPNPKDIAPQQSPSLSASASLSPRPPSFQQQQQQQQQQRSPLLASTPQHQRHSQVPPVPSSQSNGTPSLRELRAAAPGGFGRSPSRTSSRADSTRDMFSSRQSYVPSQPSTQSSSGLSSTGRSHEHERDEPAQETTAETTLSRTGSTKSQMTDGSESLGDETAVGLGIEGTTKSLVQPDHTAEKVSTDGEALPEVESDGEAIGTPSLAQVKRASRISVKDGNPAPVRSSSEHSDAAMSLASMQSAEGLQPTADNGAMPNTFSFYDPELVNLMDSIVRADSSDALPPSGSPTKSEAVDEQRSANLAESMSSEPSSASGLVPSASVQTLRARVRESLKQAQDGQVSLDASFIETILRELEDTKTQMKTLQYKYSRMKRASYQAAHGFDMAKTEFEQQVQAREEAELETLKLRQQLAEQQAKVSSLAQQERQQETLLRRSKTVKDSIEGMHKDLAKLTVERDLTVAEVAELMAVQESKTQAPSTLSPTPPQSTSNSTDDPNKALQSRLSVRLDGVKARYRKEISDLTDRRNELMMEIEDLRQSRDVYLEETETLNARNEQLNAILSKLQARVDSLSAAETNALARHNRGPLPPPPSSPLSHAFGVSSGSSSTSTAPVGKSSGGGWFGSRGRAQQLQHQHAPSSSMSSSRDFSISGFSTSEGGHRSSVMATNFDSEPVRAGSVASMAAGRGELATGTAAAHTAIPAGAASAAAKRFKWVKSGAKSAGHGIASALPGVHSPPVPPKAGSLGGASMSTMGPAGQGTGNAGQTPTAPTAAPGEVVVREHLFQAFNVLRPTRCFSCQRNMWGQSEVRCALCGQICHSKCLQSLSISCNQPYLGARQGAGGVGGHGIGAAGEEDQAAPTVFGRALVDQVVAEGRTSLLVPSIVEKCIQAVEANGMDFEGIYRKSGGSSQLRVITQLFERGQRFDLDDTDRFNDVSAVTSVLKNYFRELPEPLLTFELHEAFVAACDPAGMAALLNNKSKEEGAAVAGDGQNDDIAKARFERMSALLSQLPRPHYDTLRTLVRHLKRVQSLQSENRMTARNLGVVFGPTLMRNRDPSKEFSDVGGKSMTIEWLTEHCDEAFAAAEEEMVGAAGAGSSSSAAAAAATAVAAVPTPTGAAG